MNEGLSCSCRAALWLDVEHRGRCRPKPPGMPTVCVESGPPAFGECQQGVAFDADVIVVVQNDQLPRRRCPARDAASDETPSIRSPSLACTYV